MIWVIGESAWNYTIIIYVLMKRVKILTTFYRPDRQLPVEYEIGAEESTSTAVIRAVSAVEGRDPSSLGPLADVLDTAALDGLFDSREDGTPRTGGRLSFVYSTCRVTVDNGEYLRLRPLDACRLDTGGREPSDRSVR